MPAGAQGALADAAKAPDPDDSDDDHGQGHDASEHIPILVDSHVLDFTFYDSLITKKTVKAIPNFRAWRESSG
jgi:hypothetical protein